MMNAMPSTHLPHVPPKKLKWFWRAVIEIAFIIFLFYSNLLMGEFTRESGHGKTLRTAITNLMTVPILVIAIVAASIGFAIFQYFRERA
jgi:small-conductance mechanosensitive channel